MHPVTRQIFGNMNSYVSFYWLEHEASIVLTLSSSTSSSGADIARQIARVVVLKSKIQEHFDFLHSANERQKIWKDIHPGCFNGSFLFSRPKWKTSSSQPEKRWLKKFPKYESSLLTKVFFYFGTKNGEEQKKTRTHRYIISSYKCLLGTDNQ